MLRVLLILVPLALAVYALVDCISTKDEEVKHLPKLVWILLIVLATVVGPLAWIFVGRERHRSGGGGGGWGLGRGGAGRGGGWVAPDDNPEFLKSLGDGPGQARPERDRGDAEPEPEQAEDAGAGEDADADEKDQKDQEPEEDVRHRDDGPEDPPR